MLNELTDFLKNLTKCRIVIFIKTKTKIKN